MHIDHICAIVYLTKAMARAKTPQYRDKWGQSKKVRRTKMANKRHSPMAGLLFASVFYQFRKRLRNALKPVKESRRKFFEGGCVPLQADARCRSLFSLSFVSAYE